MDTAIEAMAADSQFTPVVRRLGCPRGVSALTGFGLAVEIGDWLRIGKTMRDRWALAPAATRARRRGRLETAPATPPPGRLPGRGLRLPGGEEDAPTSSDSSTGRSA